MTKIEALHITACDSSIEVRCPTCKTFIGHRFYGEAATEFLKKELSIWALLDEVEGYRHGIAITHVGQDPVEYFRDELSGLISREIIAKTIAQINRALQSKTEELK